MRQLMMKIALAATTTLAMLLLAEVVVSRFFPSDPRIQVHETALHALAPGSYTQSLGEPYGNITVVTAVNSDGFRGPELLADDPRPRVMVYGDSQIQAEATALEQTYPARLQTRLSTRCDSPIEVINAGVIGYGPGQVLARLEHELSRFDPDLVIIGMYAGNDYGDLVRNKLYRIGADGTLAHNPEVALGPTMRQNLGAHRAPALVRLVRKVMERTSARRELTSEEALDLSERVTVSIARGQREVEVYLAGEDNAVHKAIDYYDADLSAEPNTPSSRTKQALMAAVLGALHQRLRDAGVPGMLLVIPAPVDVLDDFDVSIDPKAYPDYRRSTLTDGIAEPARGIGFPVLDLFPPFRARGAAPLYFGHGDDHWNPTGQDLAAELTAEFLEGNGLLPCR